MSGNAPNLTPGHRYCAADDCFNIIPDNGFEDLRGECVPAETGCKGHPAGSHDLMGETVYCDNSCRLDTTPRPASFAEFNAQPATGPTYTDLAREVDQLKEELEQARRDAAAVVAGCRHGEIRQQAFLELAHELAEMEPAARDAAIRRIIDQHEGGK